MKIVKENEYKKYEDYLKYNEGNITSIELIEIIKSLDKKYLKYKDKILKADEVFVNNMIKTSTYNPNQIEGIEEFVKSDYLANYLRKKMIEVFKNTKHNNKILDLLKNTSLKEMTKEQIEIIFNQLDAYFYNEEEKTKIDYITILNRDILNTYLLSIDTEGAIDYIKSNFNNLELGLLILKNSGLIPNPNYYESINVDKSYLNETNLLSILKKLDKYKTENVSDYIRLIEKIEYLTPYVFLVNFNNYILNKYSIQDLEIYNYTNYKRNDINNILYKSYSNEIKEEFYKGLKEYYKEKKEQVLNLKK